MKLVLRVISDQQQTLGTEAEKVFDETGGTIGRAWDNFWVLPDPERFISSKHANIQFEDGQYYLLDTSTNGVFVNGASEAVGRENRHLLQDGQQLQVGEYTIQVVLEQAEAAITSPSIATDITAPSLVGSDFTPPASSPEPTPFQPLSESAPLVEQAGASLDPLDLLGGDQDAGAGPSDVFGAEPANSQAMAGDIAGIDHAAPQEDFFQPPGAQQSAGNSPASSGIPENWDETGFFNELDQMEANAQPAAATTGASNPFTGRPQTEAEATAPPIAEPESSPVAATPIVENEQAIPNDGNDNAALDPLALLAEEGAAAISVDQPELAEAGEDLAPITDTAAVTESAASPSASTTEPEISPPLFATDPGLEQAAAINQTDLNATPPLGSAALEESTAEPATENVAENVAAAPAATGISDQAAPAMSAALVEQIQQNLQAKGIDPSYINEATIVSWMSLMPDIIQGLLNLLLSRSEIKNQFRADQTILQSAENNPLKFCVSPEDAIFNLFVHQRKGFLTPEQAFHHALADLNDHQVATLAGVRAGLADFAGKLDPERLEPEFEKGLKRGGLLGLMNQNKYWELYKEHYAKLVVDDSEAGFQQLFGEVFANAYDAQAETLKKQR